MKRNQTKSVVVAAITLWLAASPNLFASEDMMSDPEREPDMVSDTAEESTSSTEKTQRRSRRQADRTVILQDDADVNICLGYSGLKNTAPKISSFLSLLVNFDAINNISFDLQAMYALLGGNSSYYFFGGGATWFSQSGFRNLMVSAGGGAYFGPALTEMMPAARILGGWRFHEPSWIATIGIAAGPEFVFATAGMSTGLIFRADMGFTW